MTTTTTTTATTTGLRLDRFDPARDSELLHSWVTQERARFWMMQDHTVEEVREVYTWLDEQPTHHVWWVRRGTDGSEPAALLQDYQPAAEEVGEHYDVHPGDLGIHLMLAPPVRPEPGLTAAVMDFVMAQAFADPAVRRLVAEPDARNAKIIDRLRGQGFELGPVVELSTKPAQLAFLTRTAYEAR